MSTGWKWTTSDGREFKSQAEVRAAILADPELRVELSELTMAGTRTRDVTADFRGSAS